MGTGTKAQKAQLRRDQNLRTLASNFFEGEIDESIYQKFRGSQTHEILSGRSRGIDSITIDFYIYRSLGLPKGGFIDFLFKNKKRKKSFEDRVIFALGILEDLALVEGREERLSMMVEIFFILPDGANEKINLMVSIMETYFRRNSVEIKSFFFGKNEFDQSFYTIFGVKEFSRENDHWSTAIDNVSIDTYVYQALAHEENFSDLVGKDPKRSTIFNLRKKKSGQLLSTANNLIGPEKSIMLVSAVLMAPKWSHEKDVAMQHFLNDNYDEKLSGKTLEEVLQDNN